MRRLVLLAFASAGLLAATAAPAAADVCVGTEEDANVCVHPEALPSVDPTGGEVSRCVYLGTEPCTQVTVPVPTLVPGDGQRLVRVETGPIHLGFCDIIEPPPC